MPTIRGTRKADVFAINANFDPGTTLLLGSGDDSVSVIIHPAISRGDERIFGEDGNDRISSAGFVDAGNGNDIIQMLGGTYRGGAGNDTFIAGSGSDNFGGGTITDFTSQDRLIFLDSDLVNFEGGRVFITEENGKTVIYPSNPALNPSSEIFRVELGGSFDEGKFRQTVLADGSIEIRYASDKSSAFVEFRSSDLSVFRPADLSDFRPSSGFGIDDFGFRFGTSVANERPGVSIADTSVFDRGDFFLGNRSFADVSFFNGGDFFFL